MAVAGGDAHVCGVDDGADVWCWGANGSGQLGDGTTTASSSPVQVVGAGGTGSLAGIAALDAGEQFTCAAGASGASWCWGLNTSGQLGDGTTTGSLTPVRAY